MRRITLPVALLTLVSCSGENGGGTTPTQPVTPVATTMTVSEGSVTLTLELKGPGAQQSVQLSATVLDQNGVQLSGQTISWASSTPTVASVTTGGLLTAVGNGTATITATAGNASATVMVRVTGNMLPVAMLIMSGDEQVDTVGKEVKDPLIVRVMNEDSIPVQGQIVNWVITAGGGSVFAGTALTDSLGQARETWTLGTIADSVQAVEARAVDTQSGENLTFAKFTATAVADVPASVVLASDTVLSGTAGSYAAASEGNDTLTVRVRDQYGNVVKGAAVTWSVTVGDGTVEALAETADSTGRARARWLLGPDLRAQQQAQATSLGINSGSFRADASVPDDAVLTRLAGDEQVDSAGKQLADTLVVGLALADGRTVQGAGLTWAVVGERGSVSEVAAGTDAEGKARALWTLGSRVGADSVRVAVDSTAIETYFTATVQAFRLRMSAATLTLASLGQSTNLTAALLNGSGAEVSADNVTWTSSDETVATVSNGTVTSIDNGTAVIRASRAGARPDSATVTVSQANASLVVSRDTVTFVSLTDTLSTTATVYDALSRTISGASVTWASTNTAVATVSSGGLITAAGNGTAKVTATSGSVADTVSVTVSQVATSIAISSDSVDVLVGATVTVSASVRDANQRLVAGAVISWSTRSSSIATVASDGVITGAASGRTTVVATSGSLSDSVTVTVLTGKSGVIGSDESWSSFVRLTDDVKVPDGVTLTVNAGTEIQVVEDENIQVLVEGTLLLQGTNGDTIVFRGASGSDQKEKWEGIKFRNTTHNAANENGWVRGSKIEYARFSNARTAIYTYNQGLYVNNSEFTYNNEAIELRKTDSVYVANSKFSNNSYGVWTEYAPYSEPDAYGDFNDAWFKDNTFVNNSTGILVGPNQRAANNFNFTGNRFENHAGSGIQFGQGGYGIRNDQGPVSFTSNVFVDNGTGLSLDHYAGGAGWVMAITSNSFGRNTTALLLEGVRDTTNISDNFFHLNGTTVRTTTQNTDFTFDNNIVYQDSDVFLFPSVYQGSAGLQPTITSNLIDSNSGKILDIEGSISVVTFEQNVVANSSNSAPWFYNETSNNFTFSSNYIDWGASSEAAKVFDGNDDFNLGTITFASPLTSAGQSTTTRSSSEYADLIAALRLN